MVTAPESIKIARFVERASRGQSLSAAERASLEADARRRLEAQSASHAFETECLLIHNEGDLPKLTTEVEGAWRALSSMREAIADSEHLPRA